MIKISNICLHQNSIVIKFFKILKIREIFCENPLIIYVLFYDVHKENMFTINLGFKARKKGAKRIEFLVPVNYFRLKKHEKCVISFFRYLQIILYINNALCKTIVINNC